MNEIYITQPIGAHLLWKGMITTLIPTVFNNKYYSETPYIGNNIYKVLNSISSKVSVLNMDIFWK